MKIGECRKGFGICLTTRQGFGLKTCRRIVVPRASESVDDPKPFFESTPVVKSEENTTKPLDVEALVEELKNTKTGQNRGELYFALQSLFIFIVVFPPKGLGDIITTVGFIALLGGVGFIASAALSLGDNLSPLPKPREDGELVTGGLYSVTRHPMYSGLILSALGLGICTNNSERILLALALAVILDIKANKEEEFLVEKFGVSYEDYRASVKKLIPWLY